MQFIIAGSNSHFICVVNQNLMPEMQKKCGVSSRDYECHLIIDEQVLTSVTRHSLPIDIYDKKKMYL